MRLSARISGAANAAGLAPGFHLSPGSLGRLAALVPRQRIWVYVGCIILELYALFLRLCRNFGAPVPLSQALHLAGDNQIQVETCLFEAWYFLIQTSKTAAEAH